MVQAYLRNQAGTGLAPAVTPFTHPLAAGLARYLPQSKADNAPTQQATSPPAGRIIQTVRTARLSATVRRSKHMRRFYRLDVQPDLFGQWCLSGNLGRAGQVRTIPFHLPPQ
jgi:hypothetical protein